jgi:hypothetical protein
MGSRETQDLELITKVSFGKDRYHQQEDMIRWCKTTLGKGGWGQSLVLGDNRWRVDSMFGSTHFWFKEERDYLLFTLRWM